MERTLQGAILRGTLSTREAIRRYIEGGNARLTIQSKKSEDRFTFRFRRPETERDARGLPVWVSLMNGPDNESNYAFIGTFWVDRRDAKLNASPRSKVGLDAPSAQAVQWLLRQVYLGTNDEALFGRATIWHEGSCGRCGRTLTVPESVSSGFGPECIKHVGGN